MRKKMAKYRITILAGLLLSSSVFAGSYPNTESFGTSVDKNADWYRQCVQVKDVTPPTSDIPAKKITDSLAKCDAEDLYYSAIGETHPNSAEWGRVRACAFATKDNAVLMMLYANGLGVKKNMDLSLKYACRVDSAPAEMEGRVAHLQDIKQAGSGKSKKLFDLCDDITSGYMMGYCAHLGEQQEQKARARWLRDFAGRLTPAQRSEFKKLQDLEAGFAKAHGEDETDLSGTARGMMVIEAEASVNDRFLKDLGRFEKGELPRYTNTRFKALDRQLNQAYQRVMHAKSEGKEGTLEYSTVTKKDVRNTQRLWLKYRDAWVAFGHVRYPAVPAYSWEALLTQRRTKQLKDLVFDDDK